ncbi:MAG: hypothetical protein V4864_24110 [Pseudomonadota bacterium]
MTAEEYQARQQALHKVWQRLLAIFLWVLLLLLVLHQCGGDLRVPAYVLLAGNIGAYVGIHRSLGELKDNELAGLASSWLGLIVPSFVGGILAFVLYYLFISGIVSGQLFPLFAMDENAKEKSVDMLKELHLPWPSEYAKLFFWSFVAGFNQKYVVDIISSFKAKPPP